jgi:hypothetical protein
MPTAGKLAIHTPLACLREEEIGEAGAAELAGNEKSEDGDEFDF